MYDDIDGADFDVVGYSDVDGDELVGVTRQLGRRPFGSHSRSLAHGRGHGALQHPGAGGRHPGMMRNMRGRGGPGGMLPSGAPVPPWFQSAFGVSPNAEQMHTLPLTPQTNGGVFSAAVALIFFQARPQRPFRGERPVAILQATGASAVGVQPFSTLITVGVLPQQVEIGNIPISLWAPTAFGVRLAMTDAAPGVLINFPISLPTPNPITGTDTLLVQLIVIGRVLA